MQSYPGNALSRIVIANLVFHSRLNCRDTVRLILESYFFMALACIVRGFRAAKKKDISSRRNFCAINLRRTLRRISNLAVIISQRLTCVRRIIQRIIKAVVKSKIKIIEERLSWMSHPILKRKCVIIIYFPRCRFTSSILMWIVARLLLLITSGCHYESYVFYHYFKLIFTRFFRQRKFSGKLQILRILFRLFEIPNIHLTINLISPCYWQNCLVKF